MREKDKASIDDLSTAQCQDLLKWAVVDRYRWWLKFDEPELNRIKAANNRLDGKAVRRIATKYNVNRGIRTTKGKDGKKVSGHDIQAEWIADRLNAVAAKWPPALNDRAAICASVATNAASDSNNYTKGEQASAMTKLIWFLKPDGWTLFDELAADGLGIPSKKANERMPLFYEKLSERDFNVHVQDINDVLVTEGFGQIFGERVIDRYLMLGGTSIVEKCKLVTDCENYVRAMQKPHGKNLLHAAGKIATMFGGKLLR